MPSSALGRSVVLEHIAPMAQSHGIGPGGAPNRIEWLRSLNRFGFARNPRVRIAGFARFGRPVFERVWPWPEPEPDPSKTGVVARQTRDPRVRRKLRTRPDPKKPPLLLQGLYTVICKASWSHGRPLEEPGRTGPCKASLAATCKASPRSLAKPL
jgi:hypothetical protein